MKHGQFRNRIYECQDIVGHAFRPWPTMNSCSQITSRTQFLRVFDAVAQQKLMHFLRRWLSSKRRVRNTEKYVDTAYNGLQLTENRYVSFCQFAAKKKQVWFLT